METGATTLTRPQEAVLLALLAADGKWSVYGGTATSIGTVNSRAASAVRGLGLADWAAQPDGPIVLTDQGHQVARRIAAARNR